MSRQSFNLSICAALVVFGSAMSLAGDPNAILLLDQTAQGGSLPPGSVVIVIDPGQQQQQQQQENVGIVDVFTRLNVRSGPSVQHQIIGKLYPGQAIQIIGASTGWYKIAFEGREGWVCGYYIWRPGMGVRNQSITSSILGSFPNAQLTSRSSATWPGEGLKNGQPPYDMATINGANPTGPFTGTASNGAVINPMAPPQQQGYQQTPTMPGSRAGRRAADGGLDVPVMHQFRIDGQYPNGYCGPATVKMALSYYGIEKDSDYLALTDIGGNTPMYTPGEGSNFNGMYDMVRHCGLRNSVKTEGQSLAWLKQQTDAGYPVIVGVFGNYGDGTTRNGHFLVIVGVTDDGRVIMNNPGRGRRAIVDGQTFYEAWSGRSRRAIVCKP